MTRQRCCSTLGFLALALMQIFACCRAGVGGKYTVIAPGTIHSNDKYTAAVAVHHVDSACQIKVGITGRSFKESKIVEVTGSEIKEVEFAVPTLAEGTYKLTAEGINCLENFKNSTALMFAKFKTYVQIQTDKGQYKPGDIINYRVLFLDKDLKPAVPKKNTLIWLADGNLNRIEEVKNFKVVKGVYTGQFKISEFPVMGIWQVVVSSWGQEDYAVFFEVNKYILPKYEVKIEAPWSVSVRDGDMLVIVRASYTYGKPVNGKATVILSLHDYPVYANENSENEQEQPPSIIHTGAMIQGKAKIDLNVKELEAYLHSKEYSTYASIVATVEEEFTGVKINTTTRTQIYPYRYAMHCRVDENECIFFEPDKEMEVMIQLTYVDGSHLKDTKTPVELIYTEVLQNNYWQPGYMEDEEVTTTLMPPISENLTYSFKGFMNEMGFATFKVKLSDLKEYENCFHFYVIEAKYRDEKRKVGGAYSVSTGKEPKIVDTPAEELPKEWFKIEGKSDNNMPKLFQAEHFTVNSSKPLAYLDFNVIARGNIVKTVHIDLPQKPMVHNITITPELVYSPEFSIYIYYIDEQGEYHYAEGTYYIDYELENKITVTAADQVKPGQEVALKIKTAPNSFVGLRAVDQSVLLLGSNNDIRANELRDIVASYVTQTPNEVASSYYPGSKSGCITLTNGDYIYDRTAETDSTPSDDLSNSPLNSPLNYTPNGQQSSDDGPSAKPSNEPEPIQVRKDFAETWIFDNIENTDKEEFTWSKKIPDTITSWVLTGFAMNSEKGLAVTGEETKITTFKPFFISIRLPYSVKRGEVINIPALVFNYLDKTLDVEVTLDNSGNEFEFTEITNEVIGDQSRTKMVRVPAMGAAGVAFMIRPKVLGNVMLKYTAISPVAGDAIHKSMKVVPEGVTKYGNRAFFVNLNKGAEMKSSFELEIPAEIIPDSLHVEVGVVGDILGPVAHNLDNLVRLQKSNGEQTMSTLLSSYLILKYLYDTKRLTSYIQMKLRFFMNTGYQKMLNYLHTDGSFSSFGPDKRDYGSTLLTAYVARSLILLQEYKKVDLKIIEDSLEYLVDQQAKNGSFTEKNDDFFNADQANLVYLTCSVLLTLLENKSYAEKYSQEITKGLEFINENSEKSESLHALAIATYTLDRAHHAKAPEKLTKLNSLVKTDGDRKVWSTWDGPLNPFVNSIDVEISSYALLTLLNQPSPNMDEILPIIRWIISQRNSNGGFDSTQNTVVGLQALIKFAKLADYDPAKMVVDIASKGADKDKQETLKLTKENAIIYQNVELPDKTKSAEFSAKGSGAAMVQIAYQYNTLEKEQTSFEITTEKQNACQKTALLMNVCVEYKGEGEASNMAVLEINTPSGYVVEDDSLPAIKKAKRVGNVELENSNSLLVIYFDHLYKNQKTCILYEGIRVHAVAMQKPAAIQVYDFYDSNKKATEFYEVESKLCDICDGEEECSKCK
ncbi:thioester-containing protein 1 allele S1-like [Musca vetustissima]|uniref:thioester-containing protein 1 allele S1-like n=1 Tax=Musca vetustissima TaxID=27455 RepID=UPI002AB6F037|nr:thioester-containing protein 1 allele S1-like [Musca vetustissima]